MHVSRLSGKHPASEFMKMNSDENKFEYEDELPKEAGNSDNKEKINEQKQT